jgi:hypothetical protein
MIIVMCLFKIAQMKSPWRMSSMRESTKDLLQENNINNNRRWADNSILNEAYLWNTDLVRYKWISRGLWDATPCSIERHHVMELNKSAQIKTPCQ